MESHTNTQIWCTLVMLNDDYAKGAIVACQSARNVGSIYPFWCMIADGITDDTIEKLETVFDRVIKVPLISKECVQMKTKKQNEIYGRWIHHCFTKCNILNPDLFPGITDITLVDADMIFTENIDDAIFGIGAPALTFSSPWAYPYMGNEMKPVGGKNSYYNRKKKMSLQHGQIVSRSNIERGFDGGILGLACMVRVKPSAGSFENMQRMLNRNILYGDNRCVAGFDEQLFAETFLADEAPIYHIHQQYNYIVGKTKWLEGKTPKTMQWYNGKPWYSITCADDVLRSEWDDVRDWWKIAQIIIDAYPDWEKWFYSNNPKYPGEREKK